MSAGNGSTRPASLEQRVAALEQRVGPLERTVGDRGEGLVKASIEQDGALAELMRRQVLAEERADARHDEVMGKVGLWAGASVAIGATCFVLAVAALVRGCM